MKKFDDYIQDLPSKKYKYFTTKKQVFKANRDELSIESTKPISNIYFDIIEMELQEIQSNKYTFEVTLKWHGDLKEERNYYISITDNKIFWSEIQSELSRYKKQYAPMFPTLCKSYIGYYTKKKIYDFEKNPVVGWMNDDGKREFLGITKAPDTYISKMQNPFEYAKPYLFHESLKEKDVKAFFDLLTERSLLGIFAYTIHSILWFYDYYRKGVDLDGTNIFSICICGKDAKHIKWVANLLSNVLQVDIHYPYRINPNARLSCSSINTQKAVFWRYRCIPLLITHKKDFILKSAKVVKECQINRENERVHFFPVYLSTRAMNADEILDFSVDNIIITDNFPQLKLVADTLLYNFIKYLSDISANTSSDKGDYFAVINNIYDSMLGCYQKQDHVDYNEKKPELMLRIAIRAFSLFLRSQPSYNQEANVLEANANTFFLGETTEVDKKEKAINSTTTFCHLAKFIRHCLDNVKNVPVCSISQEKNGEECYYLDYETFYSHYTKFLQKNTAPVLPKLELYKLLKAENLLIMRANGKQYGMDRVITFNGLKSKRKVIIIKKNEFDALVEDMN